MRLTRTSLTLLLPLASGAPLLAHSHDGHDGHQHAADAAEASQVQPAKSEALMQWGDFDADGLDDVLAITPERRVKLLRNNGLGGFADVTAAARLDAIAGASLALWQDYDGDGDLDLFVGTEAGPSHLLKNTGGSYQDVTAQVGLNASGADRSAHWTDYDQDGLLDLHLISGQSNLLFHAVAGGTFERVELPALPEAPSAGLTPVVLNTVKAEDVAPVAAGSASAHSDGAASGKGRRPVTSGATSGGSVAGDAGAQGSGFDTHSTTVVGFEGFKCAQSIADQDGPGCIEASTTATLGMLYPLGENFFVDDFTGNVGMGTTAPARALHILTDSFWPVLIESSTNAGVQMNNLTAASSWAIYHGSDDALTFRDSFDGLTRMTISGDTGNVTVNNTLNVSTIEPGAGLRVNGMVRAGSETGSDQSPSTAYNYQGVMTRRLASTVTTDGSVVARSQHMRLVRNGSSGVFRLDWDAGALNDQVAYGTGLTSAGATVPIVWNFGGPASAGSQDLYTNTDIVRLDLVFGATFNIREMTEVTLIRSAGDFWWQGTVTSTWDQ